MKKEHGIRVTIYVDPLKWDQIKASAWKLSIKRGEKVSIGNYLMELHDKSFKENFIDEPSEIKKPKKLIRQDVEVVLEGKKKPIKDNPWINPLSKTTLAPKG